VLLLAKLLRKIPQIKSKYKKTRETKIKTGLMTMELLWLVMLLVGDRLDSSSRFNRTKKNSNQFCEKEHIKKQMMMMVSNNNKRGFLHKILKTKRRFQQVQQTNKPNISKQEMAQKRKRGLDIPELLMDLLQVQRWKIFWQLTLRMILKLNKSGHNYYVKVN